MADLAKAKSYGGIRFSSSIVKSAYEKFGAICGSEVRIATLHLDFGDEEWDVETITEFIAGYPKSKHFVLSIYAKKGGNMEVIGSEDAAEVSVTLPEREQIESVFQCFELGLAESKVTKPVKIFIGHGRDQQWRDLKDHLHEQQGYDVEAYETGPRAGQQITAILEKMLAGSFIAFLVFTGEDFAADGEAHARENVIHELGLFQGRLGFERAIVLLEKGTHEFTNIEGTAQIRFSQSNIKEVFGDVVATIKREFSPIGR
jgi:predicted nucleotide-binding protein